MTEFKKMAARQVVCDICGAPMHPEYGGGCSEDRMVCERRRYCGAEIVFSTSTEQAETKRCGDCPKWKPEGGMHYGRCPVDGQLYSCYAEGCPAERGMARATLSRKERYDE